MNTTASSTSFPGFSPRLGLHAAAFAAAVVELGTIPTPGQSPVAGVTPQFVPGQRVHGPHGFGTVTGYNTAGGFYAGSRFPYVVLFEDGYNDVYSDNDLTPA